ncbi:MAG: hypothetical protein RMJ98_06070 [Myxococcales bacterium]|nr:hypothetical protein [Polyangiaceae bacterium]MDW8248855.1 hypothetical protein [Myxococcales bacterium]
MSPGSCSMVLRNPFALAARGAMATTFKDKRTPRGGSQNQRRRWLEEVLEEAMDIDDELEVSLLGKPPPAPGSGRLRMHDQEL